MRCPCGFLHTTYCLDFVAVGRSFIVRLTFFWSNILQQLSKWAYQPFDVRGLNLTECASLDKTKQFQQAYREALRNFKQPSERPNTTPRIIVAISKNTLRIITKRSLLLRTFINPMAAGNPPAMAC